MPVKKNNDLLVLWSDVYTLTQNYRLVMNPKRILRPTPPPPIVELDDRFYKNFDDMAARFPYGPPSLVHCEHLHIVGDVRFGRDVVVRGDVGIINESDTPLRIADGRVLKDRVVQNINRFHAKMPKRKERKGSKNPLRSLRLCGENFAL